MLAVFVASLAQSGAGSPALQKTEPAQLDARGPSVLQPSGMPPSKMPPITAFNQMDVGLSAKEIAHTGTGSSGQTHHVGDGHDHPSHTASSAARSASEDRRAAEKSASEERRAAAKHDHEARANTNYTTAPDTVDKDSSELHISVGGGGGHEPKAVSVVTAIMLLSSLAFGIGVFYLVNWPNATIVNHSWSAISLTICIFCAVLIFNASNGMTTWLLGQYDDGVSEPPMEDSPGHAAKPGYGQEKQGYSKEEAPHREYLSAMGWKGGGGGAPAGESAAPSSSPPDSYVFALAFAQFLVWYMIFGISMIYFSGVKGSIGSKKGVPATHEAKHLNAKAGCMLLAHVAGFSAINCFSIMMRTHFFSSSAVMALLATCIAVCIVLMCMAAYRALRKQFVPGDTADHHLLEEEAEEGGEDVMALLASFLIVQVFRFGICGDLPDGHGGEPEGQIGSHGLKEGHFEIAFLVMFGYFSATLCGVIIILNSMPSPFSAFLSTDRVQQAIRMLTITSAMVHCWCLYFAGVWIMAASDMAEWLEVYEDSALLKVILACFLTVYAFTLIFVLEKFASLDCTGPKVDQAIYTIMGSLGILVGFTWEQAFERSVGTVCQAVKQVPEPLLKCFLALFLVAMVLPAWRMYIILHTLHHSTEHMADDDYDHTGEEPGDSPRTAARKEAISKDC